MSLSWIDHYVVSFFISCNPLYFNVYFVWYEDATPAFFCSPFAFNIFFHTLSFNLYVSWGLKWVSCRQHIYGSCLCIHSASLCLLVGVFNPFTFKVIIDIYVPIAIVLIVWSWYCRSFFFFHISWLISPLNICYKAGLGYWIPLTFACLKSFLYLHQFWMRSLLGTVILFTVFTFQYLNIVCHSFLDCRVSAETSVVKHMRFPCMLLVSSPLLLLIFFLCI